MKFVDYIAECERLWIDVHRQGPAGEWGWHPAHRVWDAFMDLFQREYWISERARVRIWPGRSALYPYSMSSERVDTMCTNLLPHQLTPAEHRMIADIVEMVEMWVAGQLDELPPSGVWSAVSRERR